MNDLHLFFSNVVFTYNLNGIIRLWYFVSCWKVENLLFLLRAVLLETLVWWPKQKKYMLLTYIVWTCIWVWVLSYVVGELLRWWGTEGQPEAGSQMLPLQVTLQISFHRQLSGSFSTATDWRSAVNVIRGRWNTLPVVHIRGLRVCADCVCLFPHEVMLSVLSKVLTVWWQTPYLSPYLRRRNHNIITSQHAAKPALAYCHIYRLSDKQRAARLFISETRGNYDRDHTLSTDPKGYLGLIGFWYLKLSKNGLWQSDIYLLSPAVCNCLLTIWCCTAQFAPALGFCRVDEILKWLTLLLTLTPSSRVIF